MTVKKTNIRNSISIIHIIFIVTAVHDLAKNNCVSYNKYVCITKCRNKNICVFFYCYAIYYIEQGNVTSSRTVSHRGVAMFREK